MCISLTLRLMFFGQKTEVFLTNASVTYNIKQIVCIYNRFMFLFDHVMHERKNPVI